MKNIPKKIFSLEVSANKDVVAVYEWIELYGNIKLHELK